MIQYSTFAGLILRKCDMKLFFINTQDHLFFHSFTDTSFTTTSKAIFRIVEVNIWIKVMFLAMTQSHECHSES